MKIRKAIKMTHKKIWGNSYCNISMKSKGKLYKQR